MSSLDSSGSAGSPLTVSGLVRAYILRHDLKPGDRLPRHEDLANELGIGLRRLREGLSVLRDQGLVETNRKGGTRLTHSSVGHFTESMSWHLEAAGCSYEDLLRARAVLEAAIGMEAAVLRTDVDIEALNECLDLMRRAKTHDFHDVDKAFHQAMLECTQNPAIKLFGQLLESQLEMRKPDDDSEVSEDHIERQIDDHHKIHRCILDKDPAGTAESCYLHMLRDELFGKYVADKSKTDDSSTDVDSQDYVDDELT